MDKHEKISFSEVNDFVNNVASDDLVRGHSHELQHFVTDDLHIGTIGHSIEKLKGL